MRVVLVGAGIGGLTAAGLLRQAGHEVVLVEKASEFGQVGAGIQIAPNASRVIAALGLADELASVGTTADRIVYRRWADDSELMTIPVGDAHLERYGHPYYNVYRPDLIDVLTKALDGVELRLGAEVVGAETMADGAAVELASGDAIEGDAVIAADGIGSGIRTALFGQVPGRFSGWIAYRALVPRERVEGMAIEITNRLGPDRHLVSYFVGRDQRFLNLVCVVPEESWDVESWSEPGRLSDLRAAFADWSSPCQAVLDEIEEPVFRWALYDREPLERWTSGRITLLGDACHPMVPFMAQGACMAIEDGAVLTRCLDRDATVDEALQRYEWVRRPRATKLQNASWRNCTTFHLPDGPEQEASDRVYGSRSGAGSEALAALDKIQGYDAINTSIE